MLPFAACVKQEDVKAAPSSSISLAVAHADASAWAMRADGRSSVAVVGTGSMRPYFWQNSVLLLERVQSSALTVGDIAMYERNGGNVVHRVVEVGANGAVLFSGDNNNASDGWIEASRIKWRVAGIIYSQR
jgi:signal peptidase I